MVLFESISHFMVNQSNFGLFIRKWASFEPAFPTFLVDKMNYESDYELKV
jgi:hypothetical protein